MEYDLALFFTAPTDENARAFLRAVLALARRTGVVIDTSKHAISLSNISTGSDAKEDRDLVR
jgi:hypothetical protein